ncbi:MAG: hypothetical protein ACI9OF_001433, partial [Saprospiraceae bacterium]
QHGTGALRLKERLDAAAPDATAPDATAPALKRDRFWAPD